MSDRKLIFCEEDDPRRCQAIGRTGQCPYLSEPNINRCKMHGQALIEQNKAQAIRNFRLQKWQSRLNEFADNNKIKSLREEIGLARICLEEIFNRCEDGTDILLHHSKISNLLNQVERLVVSCHKLEQSTGMLLDKQQALHIANTIINIITSHIMDEALVMTIANDIISAIMTVPGRDDDQ